MSISFTQLSSSKLSSSQADDFSNYLRAYWKLRVDVWFDCFKSHPEQCDCCDCFNRCYEFFEWSGPGRCHDEECDCDYCMPANSKFCTCEECIPDIVEFDAIGEVPLVPGPHSDLCKCVQCGNEADS